MRLSGDGKRVAFLMFGNGGSRIALDDKIVVEHDSSITVGMPITLSLDGSTLAYRITDTKTRKDRILILGREPTADFDRVGLPVLTADGTGLAFWAQQDNRFFLTIRGEKTPMYDDVSDPVFSLDGSHVAYATKTGNLWTLRCGARESPLPAKPTRLFIANDGSRAGAVVITRPAPYPLYRVVAEGGSGADFDEIGLPVFSPDGRRLSYRARSENRWRLIVDDKTVDAAGIVGDPMFIEEGRSVAYGAQVGRDLWWRITDAAAPQPVHRFADRMATVVPPERVSFDDIEPVEGRLDPLYGSIDAIHREEGAVCCRAARCTGARSPAVVDVDRIRREIDEFARARRRDPDGAAYEILVQRGNERFLAALRDVLREFPIYDAVFAKGAVRLSEISRATGIPDLTPAILQRIK